MQCAVVKYHIHADHALLSKLWYSVLNLYSFYDPLLTVNGDAILCVGQDTKSDLMFKILGRQL
jgi:hypothetical protein